MQILFFIYTNCAWYAEKQKFKIKKSNSSTIKWRILANYIQSELVLKLIKNVFDVYTLL